MGKIMINNIEYGGGVPLLTSKNIVHNDGISTNVEDALIRLNSTIRITDLITSTKDCTITGSTFVKTGNVIQIYMTVAINPSVSQFTMGINNKYAPLLDYGILSVRKPEVPYTEIGTGWVYSGGKFGFYINQNGSTNFCYINGIYIAKS